MINSIVLINENIFNFRIMKTYIQSEIMSADRCMMALTVDSIVYDERLNFEFTFLFRCS